MAQPTELELHLSIQKSMEPNITPNQMQHTLDITSNLITIHQQHQEGILRVLPLPTVEVLPVPQQKM